MRNTVTPAFIFTLIGLLFAPTTQAAPTLGTATPESLADSRPLLAWTLGPNEEVGTITVSTSADRTPEGEFFDENRVTGDFFAEGATTRWQPTGRIPAGNYWWNLSWYAADYSASGYTDVGSFVIPALLRSPQLAVRQYLYVADELTLSFVTNARRAIVTCSVYAGRRRVARRVVRTEVHSIGSRTAVTCNVGISSKWAGNRLRVQAVARAGGQIIQRQRFIIGRRR